MKVLESGDVRLVGLVRQLVASGDIRRVRQELGLSVAEVAAVVGVTREAVSAWERGAIPRTEVALRYGRLLIELTGDLGEAVEP